MRKDFFAQLFDLSFKSFITVRVIKILYVFAIIISVLIGLAFLIGGINSMKYSPFGGFLRIIIAPVIVFFKHYLGKGCS